MLIKSNVSDVAAAAAATRIATQFARSDHLLRRLDLRIVSLLR